ncbi:hypothetical protein DOTSEDRAFT_20951 [Dothistroma septosporum NZE10]|uniref:Uncharacterized protein n=1 Tax=Dothistroma septosporum (strain NZE10 / CBS 128990) TaxID=675120 RepID=N1PW34_DOTSN|nr:hypothetical protein DOTSEDRAFT_20951 [Dothistroma septosporum NZE10]
MAAVRRSTRSASALYNSNGRDYLASELGCSQDELNAWLKSSKVRPHVQVWYKLCVLGRRRCQEITDWIARGTHIGKVGYFYDDSKLQNDVLLECLCEGNIEVGTGYEISIFADPSVHTYNWSTQEIWARSAWRIVQENASPGDVFELMVLEHAARAYALVIDILSIAFHSITFRRSESVWEEIIDFGTSLAFEPTVDEAAVCSRNRKVVYRASQLDQTPDPGHEKVQQDDQSDTSSVAESEASTIYYADDADFEEPSTPSTKAVSVRSSPRTPKKSKKWRDVVDENDTIVVARSVDKWLRGKSATPTPMRQQLVRMDFA